MPLKRLGVKFSGHGIFSNRNYTDVPVDHLMLQFCRFEPPSGQFPQACGKNIFAYVELGLEQLMCRANG